MEGINRIEIYAIDEESVPYPWQGEGGLWGAGMEGINRIEIYAIDEESVPSPWQGEG
jgi:hypothetical protein